MAGQDSEIGASLSPLCLSLMRELLLASQLAVEAGRSPTDFSIAIDAVTRLGVTHSEIRYLLCAGYVEHRIDYTLLDQAERIAVLTRSLRLSARSCLLLTVKGIEMARSLFRSECPGGSPAVGEDVIGPQWDTEARILRFDGGIILRFARHAPAQERILKAFEEERWAVRIDDPLPPNGHTDPKLRLNRSIHRLNGRLLSAPIHFCSDGRGEGICWHESGKSDGVCEVI